MNIKNTLLPVVFVLVLLIAGCGQDGAAGRAEADIGSFAAAASPDAATASAASTENETPAENVPTGGMPSESSADNSEGTTEDKTEQSVPSAEDSASESSVTAAADKKAAAEQEKKPASEETAEQKEQPEEGSKPKQEKQTKKADAKPKTDAVSEGKTEAKAEAAPAQKAEASPKKAVPSGSKATANAKSGPTSIGWGEFFDGDDQTTPSERFWDLSGSTVTIKGFMGEVLSFDKNWFLLIPEPGAECPFDNGDETYWNKIMIVFVPDDVKLRYKSGAMEITGRLDVGIKIDESGYKTMFRLYDASFKEIKE